jgi:hypothetical protein
MITSGAGTNLALLRAIPRIYHLVRHPTYPLPFQHTNPPSIRQARHPFILQARHPCILQARHPFILQARHPFILQLRHPFIRQVIQPFIQQVSHPLIRLASHHLTHLNGNGITVQTGRTAVQVTEDGIGTSQVLNHHNKAMLDQINGKRKIIHKPLNYLWSNTRHHYLLLIRN